MNAVPLLPPGMRRDLRILFLAPFAPDAGAERPDMHPVHGVAPRYNYEIYTTLLGLGLDVVPCRDLDHFAASVGQFDFVFTLFNFAPFRNSELFVSTVCERAGVAYLGAPPNVRALAEDKLLTKLAAQASGLPVVPGVAWRLPREVTTPPFPGPWFVKPRFGSASAGVTPESVREDVDGLRTQVAQILDRWPEALVEPLIDGTDLTVPVIGGETPLVLPPCEEVSDLPHGIATYRQKRLIDRNRVRRVVEDPLLAGALMDQAAQVAALFQPFDYLRVDFRREAGTGRTFVMEVNIGCNLGSHAAIALAARTAGIEHPDLIARILTHSLTRQADRLGRRALAGT
ncbi:hypothetical protein [Zavarzinia sp. CC-PAN008]|uniref:hypothetical protein n=1 Tax=Zavarzinia sp. CC-PAN008 TaxID=3243332 RepID=UPI003F74995B